MKPTGSALERLLSPLHRQRRRILLALAATGLGGGGGDGAAPTNGFSVASLVAGAALNGARPFPADNPRNSDIAAAPVDPASEALIASIGLATGLHPDFGAGLYNGAPIGIPYVVVAGTQAPAAIHFTAYGDESEPVPYPVPAGAPIEGGSASTGDCHLLSISTAIPCVPAASPAGPAPTPPARRSSRAWRAMTRPHLGRAASGTPCASQPCARAAPTAFAKAAGEYQRTQASRTMQKQRRMAWNGRQQPLLNQQLSGASGIANQTIVSSNPASRTNLEMGQPAECC